MDLYSKDLNTPAGSGEELLLATNEPKFPMDWSRDGRVLLYNSMDPKLGLDIWALPLDGERKPRAVVQTEFNEQLPQLSPDGKWMVYQSNRTGRFEVYIRPFPGPGSDAPVSAEGGAQARWNPDGKELFYIAADDSAHVRSDALFRKRRRCRSRDAAGTVRDERGQHGPQHEPSAVCRFSRRAVFHPELTA